MFRGKAFHWTYLSLHEYEVSFGYSRSALFLDQHCIVILSQAELQKI